MKNFKEKPVVLSVLMCVVFFVLGGLWGKLVLLMPANYAVYILNEIVMMALPFAFALLWGGLDFYKKGDVIETMGAGAYIITIQCLALWSLVIVNLSSEETNWLTPAGIALGILTLFGISFREETLFRGIVVNKIGEKYIKSHMGVLFTAGVSAVIFGAVHMTNIFYGINVFSAVIQSVAAAGAGFYLAAVYLRGGNIWVMMLIHTVTNAVSLFESTFLADATEIELINRISLVNLTPVFIFVPIGLYLLRKSKTGDIIERFNA